MFDLRSRRRLVSEEEVEIEVPDKLFFRIGEAAQLIGVEPHVLRYWESEFKMRPQRSSTGQRMYRRKDIARFLRIRRLLHKEGFTIAGARKALSAPAEAAPADTSRFREALTRIEAVRKHIATLRVKFAHVVVAAPQNDG
jgi:DNA-binding transcriptional MerR regulator